MLPFFVIQLKQMKEQLPPDVHESEIFKAMNSQIETFLNAYETSESSSLAESLGSSNLQDQRIEYQADTTRATDSSKNDGNVRRRPSGSGSTEGIPQHISGNVTGTLESSSARREGESIEQFEPGVYVTFIQRSDGVKLFKRVKFRYLRK